VADAGLALLHLETVGEEGNNFVSKDAPIRDDECLTSFNILDEIAISIVRIIDAMSRHKLYVEIVEITFVKSDIVESALSCVEGHPSLIF